MLSLHGLKKDFDLSLFYSMQAYTNGDLNAMNYIYNLLLKKKIQQKNMPNVIEFIKKAADLDDTIAMVAYVTYLTNNCEPTPEVLNDQIHYSKLAADKGNPQGMFCYGLFLQNGLGIERNIPEATHYYKMAADLGHPVAQLHINQLTQPLNDDYLVSQLKSVANNFDKLVYETLNFMKTLKEIENAAAKNTNDSNNNPVNDSNQNNLNDDSISSSLSNDSNYNLDRNMTTNKNINQNTVPQKKNCSQKYSCCIGWTITFFVLCGIALFIYLIYRFIFS